MSQSYDLLLCLSLSLYSINTGTIKNRHAHYHRIHRSAESSSWRGLSADFCKLNLNPHERTSAASRGLLDPRVRPFVPASRRLPRARTVNTPKLMFVEFKAACKQPHGAVLCYAIRCERRGKTGRFMSATATGYTRTFPSRSTLDEFARRGSQPACLAWYWSSSAKNRFANV